MTAETLREFLAWCLVGNVILVLLMTVGLGFFGQRVATWHSRMFGCDRERLPMDFYRFIAWYKLAVLFLNAVPYFALRMMA